MKVLTVVGTRPEIIRLSATIKLLDEHVEHVLVHTGQNYDYELNEVFFSDLSLRKPDRFMHADTSSIGAAYGSILCATESILAEEKPDAFLVLGDTNSCIAALMAKRMQIPVFHMEAGNRSFDENVPEETNRRLVDHVSDYNLVYTSHARQNLLREGIHPDRIILTGSPMREVIEQNATKISASRVLSEQGLEEAGYFLVSLHRQENVDSPSRLGLALDTLEALRSEYGLPVLVSTHPRTARRLESLDRVVDSGIHFHKPFGFHDYVHLQTKAKLVLSDSGTISEESSLLGFPAVTLRRAIERPESVDTGSIVLTDLDPLAALSSIRLVLEQRAKGLVPAVPADYTINDTSYRAVAAIHSYAHSHRARSALHPPV